MGTQGALSGTQGVLLGTQGALLGTQGVLSGTLGGTKGLKWIAQRIIIAKNGFTWATKQSKCPFIAFKHSYELRVGSFWATRVFALAIYGPLIKS